MNVMTRFHDAQAPLAPGNSKWQSCRVWVERVCGIFTAFRGKNCKFGVLRFPKPKAFRRLRSGRQEVDTWGRLARSFSRSCRFSSGDLPRNFDLNGCSFLLSRVGKADFSAFQLGWDAADAVNCGVHPPRGGFHRGSKGCSVRSFPSKKVAIFRRSGFSGMASLTFDPYKKQFVGEWENKANVTWSLRQTPSPLRRRFLVCLTVCSRPACEEASMASSRCVRGRGRGNGCH